MIDSPRRLPALLAVLPVAFGALACGPAPPERIVLVVADTLRRDHLGPYAGRAATPAVDALAARGQVFTNAISSFHQTTMSTAAVLTGRTPSIESGERTRTLPWTARSWCGMARFAEGPGDSCVPQRLATLAEDLRGAGYETLAVVANRLLFRPYGYDQGFDRWEEVGTEGEDRSLVPHEASPSGDEVNARVRRVLQERASDRFFLYVHYMDPHDYAVRADLADYAAGVRAFDAALGGLLGTLEEAGLLDGAMVVLTADHGELLGEPHPDFAPSESHLGNPSYEGVLAVPLIVAPPTFRSSAQLLRSQDVRNLVRERVGLPVLPAEPLADDEVLLSEAWFQTLRKGRFKSVWRRDGDRVALFDLEADPGETRDVAAAHPEVVAAHRARIRALASALATRTGEDARLEPEDAARLRAMGYLE